MSYKNIEVYLFYIVCTENHSISLIEFMEENIYGLISKRMNTDILHVYSTQNSIFIFPPFRTPLFAPSLF